LIWTIWVTIVVGSMVWVGSCDFNSVVNNFINIAVVSVELLLVFVVAVEAFGIAAATG